MLRCRSPRSGVMPHSTRKRRSVSDRVNSRSFSLEGDFIAEGDKVVARWKGVATQTGAFGSIPATGKSATWTGISIFRIADGKVAEEIGEEDALSVFQQLGVVPPLEQGGMRRALPKIYSIIRHFYGTFTTSLPASVILPSVKAEAALAGEPVTGRAPHDAREQCNGQGRCAVLFPSTRTGYSFSSMK